MTLTLPTVREAPTLDPDHAKVLLYGPPKIGKTTLAATMAADTTLLLAAEPGVGAVDAFKMPVGSWADFREIGGELAQGGHPFQTVVIDTVDALATMCRDAVMERLGATHPSDLEWGKGWDAVSTEFQVRVAKLASLGLGVWFISHAKEMEIKQRVGTTTKWVPDLTGKIRSWLVGFADFQLFLTSELHEEGELRVLRTAASEAFEAGGRVPPGWTPLPDPIVLPAPTAEDPTAGAVALRKAMTEAAP